MKRKNKQWIATVTVIALVVCLASAVIMKNELSMTGGSLKVAEANNKKLVPSNNKYGLKTPAIQDVTRKPLTRKMKDALLKKTEKWFKEDRKIYLDNYTDYNVDYPGDPTYTINVDDADYVKITWKKVNGATGYQIKLKYYVDGEELTALNLLDKEHPVEYHPYVKNTTKTSVTINELQSDELIGQNATIKLWIRAYKSSGGKKYYGNWSTVTTVKPNKHLPSAELLSIRTDGDKTTITVMPNDIYLCQAAGQEPAEVLFHLAPVERNEWCYVQDGYQVQYSNSAAFEEYETIKVPNDNDFYDFMKHMEGKWSSISYGYVETLRTIYPSMAPVSIEFPSGYKYMRVRTYKVINGKTKYGVWTSGMIKEMSR